MRRGGGGLRFMKYLTGEFVWKIRFYMGKSAPSVEEKSKFWIETICIYSVTELCASAAT
jgi:hypothetical protein